MIGASVWIAFGIVNWFGALIVRPTALTMPAVTVFGRPNGLPIAITLSPTCTALESPSVERMKLRGGDALDADDRRGRRRVGADDGRR